jgi:FkbM family methyltransferase
MASRMRFSLVEVACLCLFAVVTALTMRPARIEQIVMTDGFAAIDGDLLPELAARYGDERHSQGPEEHLIRDFFQDLTRGTFVDVGAYEPVKYSNTYFLEHRLEWAGIAIDALEDFAPAYRELRPRSRFVVAFVADRNEGFETIHYNPAELAVSSSNEAFTRRWHTATVSRQVPVRTLDAILDEQGLTSVDFVNMDVELGEPAALKGFSIDRFAPRLVCVEAHGITRQAILDYFADHGYVVVGKYLRVDKMNLYFTPRPATKTTAEGSS